MDPTFPGVESLTPWHNTTKGKYYVRVKWEDGTESRHPLGTANQAEVELAIRVFVEQRLPDVAAKRTKEIETVAPPHNRQLQDAARWYINTHVKFIKGRKAKTVDHYDRVLNGFLQFCRMRNVGTAQQLSTRIIQEWQVWRNEHRKTWESRGAMRDELLALRRFLSVAQDAGELPELDKIRWDIPGKTKSQRFQALSDLELGRLANDLHDFRPEFMLPVLWMIDTPWLPSDTCDFRIGEDKGSVIDRDRIKSGTPMGYPVTPELRALITAATHKRALRATDHVFLTRRGQPWTYEELESKFQTWAEKRGHDLCFRDLRVTWASNQARAGMPPAHLAQMLGHKDPTIVLKYYVRVDMPSLTQWQNNYASQIAEARTRAQNEFNPTSLVPFHVPQKNSNK